MNQMELTKGPWRRFGGMVDGYGIASDSGVVIEQDAFNGLHNQANANLIAAAPELLEAIKVLLRNRELGEYESQHQGLPRMIEANDMARKAIAKAEKGE